MVKCKYTKFFFRIKSVFLEYSYFEIAFHTIYDKDI